MTRARFASEWAFSNKAGGGGMKHPPFRSGAIVKILRRTREAQFVRPIQTPRLFDIPSRDGEATPS